jgi:CheY-like chemotaxis protein
MPLSKLRILVVDDYEPIRFLKARLLRKSGAEVLEAKSGAEALKILETEKIDLAVLDINLPDMSAMQLRDLLRAAPATASLPLIYTSASERHSELDAGEVFFQELIDANVLNDAIRKLVGRD